MADLPLERRQHRRPGFERAVDSPMILVDPAAPSTQKLNRGSRRYPVAAMILSRRLSSRRAAVILHRVFDRAMTGCGFRLWDGTCVTFGDGVPVCTVVVHRPETLVRLMRDPSPYNFAEAYVGGDLDLEGDLFAAMKIADAIEEVHVSVRDRLRVLVDLWRG
jgi:hypothetical protein